MILCLKYLVHSFQWTVELGVWEVVFFPVSVEIIYYFLLYFGIVQIWLCTTVWIRGFGLRLSFTSQRDSQSVLDMDLVFIAIP